MWGAIFFARELTVSVSTIYAQKSMRKDSSLRTDFFVICVRMMQKAAKMIMEISCMG